MRILLGLIWLVAAFSCATHQVKIHKAKNLLLSGNCDDSLVHFEKLAQDQNDDQLLHLMEYGAALQICKQYQKSSEIFLAADRLSEQLDYHSVSRVIGATLLNEELIQYKGDTFEKFFINSMSALNYLELGLNESAMVEVRRIDEKYKRYTFDNKKKFELNSFSKYLSGLIWESEKQYDDACIAYQAAYKLDMSLRPVAMDMLRSCWLAKRYNEYKKLAAEVQVTPSEEIEYTNRLKKSEGQEVVVLFLQGLGPTKTERSQNSIHPSLVSTFTNVKKIVAEYEGKEGELRVAESRLVYNVEKNAIETLREDQSSLAGRRFGARIAKEVFADQIRQKDKGLGDLAWFVMVASEKPDLRNWSLLPESIQVLRVRPLKNSKIKITGQSAFGATLQSFEEIDLSLNPNKKIYIIRSIK